MNTKAAAETVVPHDLAVAKAHPKSKAVAKAKAKGAAKAEAKATAKAKAKAKAKASESEALEEQEVDSAVADVWRSWQEGRAAQRRACLEGAIAAAKTAAKKARLEAKLANGDPRGCARCRYCDIGCTSCRPASDLV